MRSRLQTIVGAIVLGVAGGGFLFFGVESVRFGGIVLGAGFVLIGTLSVTTAIIFGWRGHRLGAEVKGEAVIVHHYFSDTVIPLSKVRSVYKGSEGTRIETLEGAVFIDDCYFGDSASCDVFYETLTNQLNADVSTPQSFHRRLRVFRGIAKYADATLRLVGSCAFLLFGFDRLLHRDWVSGVVFGGIGLGIAFLFRPKAN